MAGRGRRRRAFGRGMRVAGTLAGGEGRQRPSCPPGRSPGSPAADAGAPTCLARGRRWDGGSVHDLGMPAPPMRAFFRPDAAPPRRPTASRRRRRALFAAAGSSCPVRRRRRAGSPSRVGRAAARMPDRGGPVASRAGGGRGDQSQAPSASEMLRSDAIRRAEVAGIKAKRPVASYHHTARLNPADPMAY